MDSKPISKEVTVFNLFVEHLSSSVSQLFNVTKKSAEGSHIYSKAVPLTIPTIKEFEAKEEQERQEARAEIERNVDVTAEYSDITEYQANDLDPKWSEQNIPTRRPMKKTTAADDNQNIFSPGDEVFSGTNPQKAPVVTKTQQTHDDARQESKRIQNKFKKIVVGSLAVTAQKGKNTKTQQNDVQNTGGADVSVEEDFKY